MKYDNILIDISNFYHRANAVGGEHSTVDSKGRPLPTGGIFMFLNMLNKVENEFLAAGGKMWFLFDNCYSGINRRKEIDPEYKATRTKKDDAFYASIDILHTILLNYKDSYVCVQKQGYEADDLVRPIVAENSIGFNLLVSNDMDWFREISDNTHVAKYDYKLKNYIIYNREVFTEEYGFNPDYGAICVFKAFRGDDSDNIPVGVEGIRTKDLVKIAEACRSIKDVVEKLDTFDLTDSMKAKVKANIPRLRLNESLVRYQPVSYAELADCMYKSTFNPRQLHSIYKALGFSIPQVDPRVAQFFVRDKKPVNAKNFFTADKVKRV